MFPTDKDYKKLWPLIWR